MGLNKRWRIAIGCGCLGVLVSATLIGAVAWRTYIGFREGRDKARLRAEVAAVPFAIPSDGVVPEERLQLFLEVCRRTAYVDEKYAKDREDLDQSNARGELNLRAIGGTFAYTEELALARAHALKDLGMGMREFRWTILSLGETPWDGPLDPSLPDLERRGATTDAKNMATFQRHAREIHQCFDPSQMAQIRQELRGFRDAIRMGAE